MKTIVQKNNSPNRLQRQAALSQPFFAQTKKENSFFDKKCEGCEKTQSASPQLKPLFSSSAPQIQTTPLHHSVSPSTTTTVRAKQKPNQQARFQSPLSIQKKHRLVSSEFLDSGWQEVNELGIAYKETGAFMRNQPSPTKEGSKIIGYLWPNEKVFILSHNPKTKWFAVTTLDRNGSNTGFGYVADWLLWRRLPEPNVHVKKIKAGEYPLKIAATSRNYLEVFSIWGEDLRFVVNALVYVNNTTRHNGTGEAGLRKKNNKLNAKWYMSKSTKDVYIWLPSAKFLQSLYKTVVAKGGGTGSITADLWNSVKQIYNDVAYGLSFVGGIIHGFLKSLYDTVVGIVKLAYDLLTSILTGSVIKDAKKLWKTISSLKWQDIVDALDSWAMGWAKKLSSDSPWVAGHAHGYLTGYIMAEAAMLLISGGTLQALKGAKWFGKLAQAIESTGAFTKFQKGIAKAQQTGGKTSEALAKAGKVVKASKLFKTIGEARHWAKLKLNLAAGTLADLSLDAINKLKELPEWALNKLSKLSQPFKRLALGCTSPCKVDVDAILTYLKALSPATKSGSKVISSLNDLLAALPPGLKQTMIKKKLKKHPALLDMMKELKITQADFDALTALKFLTKADAKNAETAYRTFTKYLSSIASIKAGKDVKKLNAVVEKMVKADKGIGAALKGSMFETWLKVFGGRFKNLTFGRATFNSSLLKKVRTTDGFIKSSGGIWDFKHTFRNILSDSKTAEQAQDYFKILTRKIKSTDGHAVQSVNYVFPTKAAAELNKGLMKMGFRVFYVSGKDTISRLK